MSDLLQFKNVFINKLRAAAEPERLRAEAQVKLQEALNASAAKDTKIAEITSAFQQSEARVQSLLQENQTFKAQITELMTSNKSEVEKSAELQAKIDGFSQMMDEALAEYLSTVQSTNLAIQQQQADVVAVTEAAQVVVEQNLTPINDLAVAVAVESEDIDTTAFPELQTAMEETVETSIPTDCAVAETAITAIDETLSEWED